MLPVVNINTYSSLIDFGWYLQRSDTLVPSVFISHFDKGIKDKVFNPTASNLDATYLLMNYNDKYSLDLVGSNMQVYMEDFTVYYMCDSSSKMIVNGKGILKEGLLFEDKEHVQLNTITKAFIDRKYMFIAMVSTYNGKLHSCYRPSILTIKCLIKDNIDELIKDKGKIKFEELTEERHYHGEKVTFLSVGNGEGYFSLPNLEIHVNNYSNLRDVPDIDVIISNDYFYDDFMYEVKGSSY